MQKFSLQILKNRIMSFFLYANLNYNRFLPYNDLLQKYEISSLFNFNFKNVSQKECYHLFNLVNLL